MSEGNGYCTRDALLGRQDQRRFVDVEIAGYGKFRLRSLTALEANTVQAKVLAEDDTDRKVSEIVATNCRLISQCVVNGDGQRIFGDLDVKSLLNLDAAFTSKLAKACQDHAGIDPDAAENAEKNSAETVS